MPLSAGTKLGTYSVLSQIGADDMGEMYQAHDTKLGRGVATKVLPEAFTRDHERLARFRREAKMLAQLNHPHIAAIYGLEESSYTKAFVMELVESPTLADKADINLLRATGHKVQKNRLKYLADVVRGSSKKYADF